jgi:hypothetical protein
MIEKDMLMHLPIVIAMALPLTPATYSTPKFDITRECSLEGGTVVNQGYCKQTEKQALQQLHKEWPQFTNDSRQRCLSLTAMDGTASYVEYLTCLEMARDVRNSETGSNQASQTEGRAHNGRK